MCKYGIFTHQHYCVACRFCCCYWQPQLTLFQLFVLGCGPTKQPVIIYTRYMFGLINCTRPIYKNVRTWSLCLCLSSTTLTQTPLWHAGIFGSDVAGSSPAEPPIAVSDGLLQCAGWKAGNPISSGSLQPTAAPWSSSDYNQQDRSAQTLAYSATPTLTADVYMQTLCPSYTMLTYTHAPLLTNFGVSRTGEQK